ncbi:hypothetical protein [Sphingobium sp.]|uniref:hypothetical protein n=1 Tax=Sphingobium sp. TaxID=1912891 RepID=UPI002614E713|nr:hypothetical protein [Sphingobium sp.]
MRAAFARVLEARAAQRRARIVTALEQAGVAAVIDGEAVVASGRGLVALWWRNLQVREAGRGR